MDDARTAVADLLDGTFTRVNRVLKDIGDEDARRRPQGLAPIVWQTGHITLTDARAAIRSAETVDIPDSYPRLFDTGTGGEADYPPLTEIMTHLHEINGQLRQLAQGADLSRRLEGSRSYATVGQALAFLLYHRGYHIGKMATLRALLNKPRVFG